MLVMAMVFSLLPMSASANDEGTKIADMIAGGGNAKGAVDVGDIYAWKDASNLYVKYLIVDATPSDKSDDWRIVQTHLDIGDKNLKGIAINKAGLPSPGLFKDYKPVYTSDTEVLYKIPLSALTVYGNDLRIAAHADVEQRGGLEALEYSLPDTATINVAMNDVVPGASSYFLLTVTDGGFINSPSGEPYAGWCIDPDHAITPGTSYTAFVYSSYESLPSQIDHPENMDLVNWILNQNFIGKESQKVPGTIFTKYDVVQAIWNLVDDNPLGGVPFDPVRVQEITDMARAQGEGFVPGCDGWIAIVFAPTNSGQIIIAQVLIASLHIPCHGESETAWGIVGGINGNGADDGLGPQNDFKTGKSWAEYIPYKLS